MGVGVAVPTGILSSCPTLSRLLSRPLQRRALRLGVSRFNEDAETIIANFNQAIEEMKEDGSYDEIIRRHTEGMAILPRVR